MKFNALVVAAMVITSVSAGGRKGFPGVLGAVVGEISNETCLIKARAGAGAEASKATGIMDDDFVTPAFDLSGYDLESMFPHGIPGMDGACTHKP
ncbi:hypothetical protein BASA61_003847 [Batrachochytrium salamandrivorans]|nr:hypothetical protein BASA61_003847 [Batrachochytrium salamandrivorans]